MHGARLIEVEATAIPLLRGGLSERRLINCWQNLDDGKVRLVGGKDSDFGCIKFEEVMDPQQALIDLLAAIHDKDMDAAAEIFENLQNWTNNGGAFPVFTLLISTKATAEITPGRR